MSASRLLSAPRRRHPLQTGVFATAALAVLILVSMQAQAPRMVQSGVYADAQATRGQALYAKQCASCHGDALNGAQGPPLVGDAFLGNWRTQPLSALASKIRNTMPADAPGTLNAAQTADIVAHILKTDGFPAGRTELASTDEALKAITWPAGPAAAAPVATTTQGKVYPPLGNMAQLMRGIFFPNSNLIFTVQTHDPGAPAPKKGPTDAGFSWVDWGAGIYGGWELVDNAAIALADASPLMLTPGIRCENGKPAPITDAAWIKYTEDLIKVSQNLYKLSQTRNQEAVSDATGDLADACAACHSAYRDVFAGRRGGGAGGGGGGGLNPNDPSNKANRCNSRTAPVGRGQ
jgi:mono/diheme cytochrome c family protein